MITSAQLQNAYIRMYKHMRDYIWPFYTIQLLADLEVAIFSAFPDMETVRRLVNSLYTEIRPILQEDEEFNRKFTELKDLCTNNSIEYDEIYQVKEVLNVED